MTRQRAIRSFLAAGLIASVSSGAALAENGPAPTRSPEAPVTVIDLDVERAVRQRQQNQQLQQLYRAQDRDRTGYRPERIEVPVMRPSCSSSVYGSSLSSGCR